MDLINLDKIIICQLSYINNLIHALDLIPMSKSECIKRDRQQCINLKKKKKGREKSMGQKGCKA